jgi:hypothetical protein
MCSRLINITHFKAAEEQRLTSKYSNALNSVEYFRHGQRVTNLAAQVSISVDAMKWLACHEQL